MRRIARSALAGTRIIQFLPAILVLVSGQLALGESSTSLNALSSNRRLKSARLERGDTLAIRANRCLLSLVENTPSRVRVACPTSSSNRFRRASRGTVILSRKDSVTVSTRRCFLDVTSVGDRRISLRCRATAPTPSPTATSTVASTATPVPTATATATPVPNANLLLSGNRLASFNTLSPGILSNPVTLAGVAQGESLVTLDRRPQNGMLYGLTYNGTTGAVQLYKISPQSGSATALGATGSFVDAGGLAVRIGVDASTQVEMDFNPSTDRIRVVTSNGQNFRIDPNTGGFVDGDSVSPGIQTDTPINGFFSGISGAAFTNNLPNTFASAMYTVDTGTDTLYIQTPAESGTQTRALVLGATLESVAGFDIPIGVDAPTSSSRAASGAGFLIAKVTGDSTQSLLKVDVTTGEILSSTPFSASLGPIVGLAIYDVSPTSPVMPYIALKSSNSSLFRSTTLGGGQTVNVTGLHGGEELVAIDFRPATGELYALAVNNDVNVASLYRIDPQTGAGTVIGVRGDVNLVTSAGVVVDLPPASNGYGFDFNPVVDRIRVVTGSGLNFRIDPNTGAAVDGDPVSPGTQGDSAINGAADGVDGAAYTNGFGGALQTTLYALSSLSDALYIQNPPNGGTETAQLPIVFNGTSLDFTSLNGFDISSNVQVSSSNSAALGSGFAIVRIGLVYHLIQIDLATGIATDRATLSASGQPPYSGLAVGEVVSQ